LLATAGIPTIAHMADVLFQPDRRRVPVDPDLSLLQTALDAGVPFAHACGGAARCSTCRVMVEEGSANLSAPTEAEARIASKLHFPAELRLACQTRAQGDTVVRRLVVDEEDRALAEGEARGTAAASVGEERPVGILFCDVRNFTTFSEGHLAYDVIHLLNRWYARAAPVVTAAGGRMDTIMGDGFLAVFDSASDAVKAGLALLEQARELSVYVQAQFGVEFRIGVGIHWGDAVLGAVGAGPSRRLTAIGDAVNFAARVESATKEAGVELLVTEAVRDQLGSKLRSGKTVDVALKGKTGRFLLHEVRGLEPS
jgi:adenylate cyclase